MFVWEKVPLAVTSMVVCVALVLTGVLDLKQAFAGFIDSNVILFVAMFADAADFVAIPGSRQKFIANCQEIEDAAEQHR
ncbi:SLC13 family permease [Klebsiella aerogenes]|uniref:SLC13 family permease n=1 Tax=Klebsiella aerogenes TaxID=548 RepID=UPI003877FD9A